MTGPPSQLIEEMKIKISPPKLHCRGAAILVILNKTYNNDKIGAILR